MAVEEVVDLVLFIGLADKDEINFRQKEFHLIEESQVLALDARLDLLLQLHQLQLLLPLSARHHAPPAFLKVGK
jgi:hypothetical protein